ncbi:MAG TPA: helix-turn-helix transcriptional regulator [Solirubrobacteraceae bacterium]|nr:helix-turn-helix transcriptional regulator [Solirubrobacteraceae bacterium]
MTAALTVVALGRAIRARRRELGLSQQALADRSGLHRTYVGGVERGQRNLSFENLVALAVALDVRLSDLIADAERHGERPR